MSIGIQSALRRWIQRFRIGRYIRIAKRKTQRPMRVKLYELSESGGR